MKNIVKIAAIAVIVVSVSGCAGVLSSVTNASMDEKTAQAKTAEYFGAPEGQVKISNFSKNLIDTTYRASGCLMLPSRSLRKSRALALMRQ